MAREAARLGASEARSRRVATALNRLYMTPPFICQTFETSTLRRTLRNPLSSISYCFLGDPLNLVPYVKLLYPICPPVNTQRNKDLINGPLAPTRIFIMTIEVVGDVKQKIKAFFSQHI